MKANRKYLCISVISGLLFAGCCTTPHITKWEYKVAYPPRTAFGGPSAGPEERRESQQAFLNELGKDGWVLVSQFEGRIFYLKRALK